MSGDFISAVAKSTPFDPAGTALTSTNVQDAIVEASSLVAGSNFSYNKITVGKTIPLYQQMIVYQDIEINSGVDLDVIGELVII